jgi:3-oxoacyl-[acyl-carrier protein] reductase
MNQIDLAGQHAIVTGAATGIGFAIAGRLLRSGADVSIWDIDQERLPKARAELMENAGAEGRNVFTVHCNVTDEQAVERGLEATLEDFGSLDILVNNAGITGPNAPVRDYPAEDWRRVLEVDLTGPFLLCRAVVPVMQTGGYGRIVNIASVAGKEGNPNAAAYSAAKAGLIALTKSLGKELAKTGIAVNCVTPAAAKTAIFDQMSEQHIAYMLSKIPMERFAEVDEIAALVAWLCSRECSFSTGAVFDLSGGRATY